MTNAIPPPQGLRQFNAEICDLLQTQHPRARALFSFIRRSLRQFHLEGIYSESDVFNEAYHRGIACIHRGTEIHTPRAWMRTTSFNVIREWSRIEQRYQPTEPDYLETLLVPEEVIEQDIGAVLAAIRELEPGDRRIIEWRILEGLTWRDISQRLVDLGEPLQTEQALRKKGQRAMQRLRQIYHTIRPPRTLVP